MLFTSEQLTNRFEQLFHEGREYWDLQKQYLSLHAAEVLTEAGADVFRSADEAAEYTRRIIAAGKEHE